MANVYVRSGAGGAGTGADWTNAYTTLGAALTAKAAGDTFWVSEDHAETAGAAKTLTAPGTPASPNLILCALHTGSVPPVAADLRTTATITTTGAFDLTLAGGCAYVYGVIFSGGTGANTNTCAVCSTTGWWRLDSCAIKRASTSSSTINVGPNDGTPGRVDLINTTVSFGNTGDSIYLGGGEVYWKNTASALAGSVPSSLFILNGSAKLKLEGVDISVVSNHLMNNTYNSTPLLLKDCKINSGLTVGITFTGPNYGSVVMSRCDSGGTNYRNEKYNYCGQQTVVTNPVSTGGASDNTTAISWKVVTSANSNWPLPFEVLPIAIWNSTTAANRTCTIQCLWNATALPNNDDVWVDFEYLGSAASPLGSFANGTKATAITTAAALTASTQAWDSAATARANTHAYVVGDIIKVASNAGRIFFCTTAGTSAGSEPGGYATAVDGGSVTDSGAVFRAAVRFTLTATASSPQPAQAGVVYAYVKAAKVSSTFYVDPLITLS